MSIRLYLANGTTRSMPSPPETPNNDEVEAFIREFFGTRAAELIARANEITGLIERQRLIGQRAFEEEGGDVRFRALMQQALAEND